MGCAEDGADGKHENEPLLVKPSVSNRELAPLLLVAGCAYSAGILPVTLFIITQQKVEESSDSGDLDLDSVSWSLTFFWVGWALAALTLLPCVDQYGRKLPYLLLTAGGLVATVVSTHAKSAALYAPAVFFIGFLLKPGGTIGYLLMQESIPKSTWATAVTLLNIICAIWGILIAVIAGAVTRDISWRVEVLIWHIPYVMILLLGPVLLNESPAFLKMSTMTTVAKASSASLYLKLCGDPSLRSRILATVPCWVAGTVGFYGLSYSAGSLSSNLYTNLALLSVADLIGYLNAGPLIARFGARKTQMLSFTFAAALLFICTLLPPGHLRVAVAIPGRLALDVAFTTIYILLLHCFPPEVRGSAAGLANFGARCAGLITPLFSLMHMVTCCLIMAGFCVLAVFATWSLPSDREELQQ